MSKQYRVTVNFNGYIGSDETYVVDAENEEEAREAALEMAAKDLDVLFTEVEEDE